MQKAEEPESSDELGAVDFADAADEVVDKVTLLIPLQITSKFTGGNPCVASRWISRSEHEQSANICDPNT